jgi:hypothetical protein
MFDATPLVLSGFVSRPSKIPTFFIFGTLVDKVKDG